MQTKVGLSVCVALLLGTSAGCRSFINLFGMDEPVRMALVTENPVELINPFSPYDPLVTAMRDELGRRVTIEPLFPGQTGPQLRSGRFHLAMATPLHYARMEDRTAFRLVAAPGTHAKPVSRPAVLIVPANSEIESVSQLADKRVAFGPKDAVRTYHAGLALLRSQGLDEESLAAEWPVVGDLSKHIAGPTARTQTVLDGTAAAAFLDEAEWNLMPELEEQPGEPCRSKLRVIARTAAVPDLLLFASPELDDETFNQIQGFLLSVHLKQSEVLEPLGYDGFWSLSPTELESYSALVAPVTPATEAE